MNELTRLVAGLLVAVHRALPLPVCRGDWLFTLALAGAVFAGWMFLAAFSTAVLRKIIGHRLPGAALFVFGVLGVLGAGLLPLLTFHSTAGLFDRSRALNLSQPSCFTDNQQGYFTQSPSVSAALFHSHDHLSLLVYLALLAGLPLLGLGFTALLGRAVFRRAPRWPGRVFYWLPYLVFALSTLTLNANAVASLWLGYVPAILLAALVTFFVGSPRYNSEKPRPDYGDFDDLYDDEPLPPEPEPQQGRLADTPGPLPFAQAPPPMVEAGGRFRRIRTLGKGGFGTVWLAMDTHLNRTVAVKFAHAPDSDAEQRMMREARALAAVRHPNCVRIYDVVTEADGLGIVMEYIEGSSLSDTVRGRGHLDDVHAARLWATMAGALDEAHRQGVLHRDVKPSNVIVDSDGGPHLIDFGIARSQGDATLTQTGMMMGTPDFLAPETAAGSGASPASDAWQLAATVSYALSGRPPRGGRDTPMAALMAAARAEPLTELASGSAHAQLLREALDPDPNQRPSLATIRRELARWLGVRGHDEDGPVATVFTAAVPAEPARPANGSGQYSGAQYDSGAQHNGGASHNGTRSVRVDPTPTRVGPTPKRPRIGRKR